MKNRMEHVNQVLYMTKSTDQVTFTFCVWKNMLLYTDRIVYEGYPIVENYLQNLKYIIKLDIWSFKRTCPSNAKLIDINPYISLLLDEHNKYRNTVAGGDLPRFQPASRMSVLTWNDELAYLASLNVKTCKMGHDQCHNTFEFKYSGQNLFYRGTTGTIDRKFFIIDNIKGWFDEYKYADMSHINRYRQSSLGTIGHFTAMVVDRTTEVGCAIIEYKLNGYNNSILACNYASTNIMNYPIYKYGVAASRCTTGRSIKYRSLCTENEPINPNIIEK